MDEKLYCSVDDPPIKCHIFFYHQTFKLGLFSSDANAKTLQRLNYHHFWC